MSKSKGWLLAATVLGCLLSATAALAVPITYTFSGTGAKGTWNGATFGGEFGAPFSFTLSGDTDNAGVGNIPIRTNRPLTGTINIGGSTGTFTPSLRVFVNHSSEAVGFRIDDAGSIPDYLDLWKAEVGLATYYLNTSFGPITNPTSMSLSINNVATSGGPLTFTTVDLATLTFSANAVPAPATLPLLGSGLLSLLGYGWRKGRRRE